jgi:hypothetical protein
MLDTGAEVTAFGAVKALESMHRRLGEVTLEGGARSPIANLRSPGICTTRLFTARGRL